MATWQIGAPYRVHIDFEAGSYHNDFIAWLHLKGLELNPRPDLSGEDDVAVFELAPGERFEPLELEDWLHDKS
jgi:hypothetical protein